MNLERHLNQVRKIGLSAACRFRQRAALTALLGVAYIATATAASFELPPLVQPASSEHHVGKIVWADLVTPDMNSAKRFYGELFGWTFHDVLNDNGKTEHTIAFIDDRPVAGLIHRDVPAGEHRQPAWLTFIAVRDINATKRMALEHGAKMLSEPRNFPRRGQQAVFADPQGAVFAVVASRSGDPHDELAAPGEWMWSSLITVDPDADAAFYQALFHYEIFDLTGDDGAEHLVLSTDDYARASVNTLPADKLHRRPHWLNYVRVANITDATAKAASLGGRVLVEPHMDRHGGRIAIIADPTGAPLGLMEWSDALNTSQEVAK